MRIGITGSNGVLGSYLQKILNDDELILFNQRIEDTVCLKKWIIDNNFDAIIHLAAIVPINMVNKNKKKSLKINFNGTKNIIDIINRFSTKKVWFFFSSTSHVYASSNKSVKENHKTNPISYYGKTKLLAEQYLLNNTKKIIPCVGRIFSFTSKKQKKSFLIPSIISKLKNKNNKVYFENLSHIRDFLQIKDICKAIKFLVKKKCKGIYNISSNKKISIKDIVLTLNNIYKKNVVFLPNKSTTTLIGNNKKILNLGWRPSKISYKNYLLKNFSNN